MGGEEGGEVVDFVVQDNPAGGGRRVLCDCWRWRWLVGWLARCSRKRWPSYLLRRRTCSSLHVSRDAFLVEAARIQLRRCRRLLMYPEILSGCRIRDIYTWGHCIVSRLTGLPLCFVVYVIFPENGDGSFSGKSSPDHFHRQSLAPSSSSSSSPPTTAGEEDINWPYTRQDDNSRYPHHRPCKRQSFTLLPGVDARSSSSNSMRHLPVTASEIHLSRVLHPDVLSPLHQAPQAKDPLPWNPPSRCLRPGIRAENPGGAESRLQLSYKH